MCRLGTCDIVQWSGTRFCECGNKSRRSEKEGNFLISHIAVSLCIKVRQGAVCDGLIYLKQMLSK